MLRFLLTRYTIHSNQLKNWDFGSEDNYLLDKPYFEKKFTFSPLQLVLSDYNPGLQYHPSQVKGMLVFLELWKAYVKGVVSHGSF